MVENLDPCVLCRRLIGLLRSTDQDNFQTLFMKLYSTSKQCSRSGLDSSHSSAVIEVEDVHGSFKKAVQQAVQSIQEKYLTATDSAHRDALHERVILACAAASSSEKDALGYFHLADVVAPLATILDRPNVSIATFQRHINEFCESERGAVLERYGSPRGLQVSIFRPVTSTVHIYEGT